MGMGIEVHQFHQLLLESVPIMALEECLINSNTVMSSKLLNNNKTGSSNSNSKWSFQMITFEGDMVQPN